MIGGVKTMDHLPIPPAGSNNDGLDDTWLDDEVGCEATTVAGEKCGLPARYRIRVTCLKCGRWTAPICPPHGHCGDFGALVDDWLEARRSCPRCFGPYPLIPLGLTRL